MFSAEQRAAVAKAFATAGYDGKLMTAEVTSEDERYFLFGPGDFHALRNVRDLQQTLQEVLRRKVGVIEYTAGWGDPVPFN